MKLLNPDYVPVSGKTYTLFGNSGSTVEYYSTIKLLADEIAEKNPDLTTMIDSLQKYSGRKKVLQKIVEKQLTENPLEEIIRRIDQLLKIYTEKTEKHLETLPLKKLWDRRLSTSREQYHMYMIEIELTNRLFLKAFKMADKKIALLPYCLKDLTVECKSVKKGFDYQCRRCSAGCFQNHASEILKKNNVEPYIWMEGDMKQLVKFTKSRNQTFGVLGIACIPELMSGMRNCRKMGIPVIGLPLNANRCVRWFGEFLPNSIDLNELEKLFQNGS